jgi:hypothetical protein
VILQCTGDDLRRAGARAAHQRDHRQIQKVTRLGRAIVLIGIRDAPARIDDEVALWQKAVRDANRLIEGAAGVAAQIEHQALHTLLRQLSERASEFRIGVLAEVLQLDVAGRRVEHDRRGHRRDVDLIAHDSELDRLVEGRAANRDVDRRAFRPAQLPHRLVGIPALVVSPSIRTMTSPRRRPF